MIFIYISNLHSIRLIILKLFGIYEYMFIYLHKNTIMAQQPNSELMEQAAYTLKAISQSTRLCVISLLADTDEMNVSQLVEELKCEQSLLSHHLTDMRAKGILNCRRDGKNCYYSLKNKQIVQIIDCIRTCNCV
jgi:DNA-binding transcriptional ArsR family regulator